MIRSLSLAVRNGLLNASGTLVSAVLGIAASVFVVRVLDPDAYGRMSYYLWLAGTLSALGLMAVPPALTRFASELRGARRDAEADALARLVTRRVIAVNAAVSAAVLAAALASNGEARAYLVALAFVPVLNAYGRSLASVQLGLERYGATTFAAIASAVAQLALVALAYAVRAGAAGYFVALSSPALVTAVALARAARRLPGLARPATRPAPAVTRAFLAFLVPSSMHTVLDLVVWQRSEVFFLNLYSPVAQVGYYGLAYTAFGLALTVGWSLINGYYPAIAADHGAANAAGVRAKMDQALRVCVLYAAPLSAAGVVTVSAAITAVFGAKMNPAGPPATVLFAGLAPAVTVGLFGLTLGAVNRPWATLPLSVAVTAVNVALDFTFIPRLGAFGAALANTGSQVAYTAGAFVIASRVTGFVPPWRAVTAILAVAAVTAGFVPAVLLACVPGVAGLAAAVAAGGAAYAFAAYHLGFLRSLGSSAARAAPARAARSAS